MAVTEEQRSQYQDLLDKVIDPQDSTTEEDALAWLASQENGDEIASEGVDLFLTGPPREQDAIAQLYPTPNNGFPQTPTNPS
jgi:hypothetical protein